MEQLGRGRSAPTVKRHLAAIRALFDYLATGGILPFNPAAAVRRTEAQRPGAAKPRCSRPMKLANFSTPSTPARSPACATGPLSPSWVYSFARIGAATGMRVEDVFVDTAPPLGAAQREGRQASMRCHATTISRPISTPTSKRAASARSRKPPCFRRSPPAQVEATKG